ncbi:MAG: TatD DNase family protein [Patescibacteria group bacterium]|nr:TatD DNase family protein [Patescibacteria group bacterium]
MKYIDIHCHLNFDDFDLDRGEAIERCREKGVGMIVVGTNIEESKKAVKLAEENSDIWAIIGLHPTEVQNEKFDYEAYKKLAENPRTVGIGECGLDYYRAEHASKTLQQEVFEQHIALANEVKKPLMLHLRSGVGEAQNAYKDTLEIIQKHAKVPGDVHFYAGSLDEAHEFIKLGFRLSFTGVITFARNYDEIIKSIPLNMIMSETDAPYVTPAPYRGKRNEPAYVTEVAHKIAEIRGESLDVVLPHLVDNARKLFGI